MSSQLLPLWRLTIYAPKAEDPTETTVLTPIIGAAHSDQFIVTSLQGIAGAKPYLGIPQGKQGTLDYLSKKTTTGNIALPVFDPRVTAGGSNAVRWSTAFMGDTLGRPRLNGCRFTLERSLDGTAGSLVPYMAGRIRNHAVKRPQWLDLDLKDYADDLSRPIFLGIPHTDVASYAASATVVPVGVPRAFGGITATPPLSAQITELYYVDGIGGPVGPAVLFEEQTLTPELSLITKALYESAASTTPRLVVTTEVGTGTVRVFRWKSGDTGEQYSVPNGGIDHRGLKSVLIEPLPTTDFRYAPIPPGLVDVTASIVLDGPPTPALPILIDDVHPVQFFADIVDGKFSRSYGLDTARPLAGRDTSGGGPWATLIADTSFGTMRDIIDASWKGVDYIEKVLCQRFNLSYRLDEQGRVVPRDLRRTNTLAGAVTLTDDDLVTDVDPAWDNSRDGAVTAVQFDYMIDKRVPTRDLLGASDLYPDIGPALFVSTKSTLLVINDLSTLRDVGEKIVKVDARATRMTTQGGGIGAIITRATKARIERELTAAAKDFLRPLSTGTIKATATYRLASANIASVVQGVYAIVQHSKLPDPASNTRGGARLMLCLTRNDQDARASITWLDCGEGSVSVTPVLGAVATPDGILVTVPVTLNASSDPVDVWMAPTLTSVAVRPADNDPAWGYADTVSASSTLTIENMEAGVRVWVRARSHAAGSALKLPSAWAYPSGSGYVDLAGTPAVGPGAEVYVPSNYRGQIYNIRRQDAATTCTILFSLGLDVAEVWAAYRSVPWPEQATDWPAVLAMVGPLGVGATSITVPLPADRQAILIRLEPRFADLSLGVPKHLVITATPQLPAIELDDHTAYSSTFGVGTQWWKITERGIKVLSVEVQTQIGTATASAWGPPTRSAGAASTVRGGTLGAGEYEHDVAIDRAPNLSWIMPRLNLANTDPPKTLGPFAFHGYPYAFLSVAAALSDYPTNEITVSWTSVNFVVILLSFELWGDDGSGGPFSLLTPTITVKLGAGGFIKYLSARNLDASGTPRTYQFYLRALSGLGTIVEAQSGVFTTSILTI